MEEACWPDFDGAGLYNLMQSISQARGATVRGPVLALDHARHWQCARQIVLLVLDGVGCAQLAMLPETAFLRRHQRAVLHSVFPSTTATAVPTFMTGMAPGQHGYTGWFMHCDELEPWLGVHPLAILPVRGRACRLGLDATRALLRLGPPPSLYARLRGDSVVFSPADIVFSPFNLLHSGGARCLPLDRIEAVSDALAREHQAGLVYVYWSDFDACAHGTGPASDAARALLIQADQAIETLAQGLRGSGTLLVVTADHGFIDAPAAHLIELETLQELAQCLARPLSGERRAVYCHVKPGCGARFEALVARDLAHAAQLWPTADLIAAGHFGPPPHHPRLAHRVGDYCLAMKSDWTLRDTLPGERRFDLRGVHGGVSAAEMQVPLVCIEC